jgi:diketogulonate reductase-like aldo/keto reductase
MRSYATYMPAVNQIEVHPWLQRDALRAATEAVGAKVMAYSPLARGHKVNDKKLVEIAKKVDSTPAQAAIKWCLDAGCITVPKSSNSGRIGENLEALKVDLSSHIEAFQALDEHYISGWDPTSEA